MEMGCGRRNKQRRWKVDVMARKMEEEDKGRWKRSVEEKVREEKKEEKVEEKIDVKKEEKEGGFTKREP
ncbi:hypothetical protein E2C01_077738 [Portunus trituberculatus]|uniref:Uncharacterized protein n=1 Tax=Portunus trituberculatus TaxID=210409 RepID=A0A5B7IQI7_PORTR|nr:hypothetical protein [Portunus trituberculatus]